MTTTRGSHCRTRHAVTIAPMSTQITINGELLPRKASKPLSRVERSWGRNPTRRKAEELKLPRNGRRKAALPRIDELSFIRRADTRVKVAEPRHPSDNLVKTMDMLGQVTSFRNARRLEGARAHSNTVIAGTVASHQLNAQGSPSAQGTRSEAGYLREMRPDRALRGVGMGCSNAASAIHHSRTVDTFPRVTQVQKVKQRG